MYLAVPLNIEFLTVPSQQVSDWTPVLVIVGLAVLAIVKSVRIYRRSGFWRRGSTSRRRRWRKSGDIRLLDSSTPKARGGKMADPLNQLTAIHGVEFEVQPLLNTAEARVLPVVEKTLSEIGKGYRVMAQTSMGEILRPKRKSGTQQDRREAFASINSKRFDFAIFDRRGLLVCAIEYQGGGHYQGKAFMRDAVKREVVRKAGVSWVEVKPEDRPEQIRADIRRALGEPPG